MRTLPTTIRPIATWEDALAVRKIRNSHLQFMTRDQTPKTVTQQKVWWDRFQRSRACRLFILETDKEIVGYGLLRLETLSQWNGDHDRTLLTGAIQTRYQGMGYGVHVFSFLILESYVYEYVPWLEVFETNAKAYMLYKQLGFKEVERKDGTITMRHER